MKMLKDIIIEKWKESYKNKDIVAKSTYESVKAKILIEEKSGKHVLPLSNNIITSIIIKEVKELKETQSYYKIEDPAFVDIERKISLLSEYLPKQLSVEEVKSIILKLSLTETNKGKLTGLVIKEIGNSFDKSQVGKLVNEIVK